MRIEFRQAALGMLATDSMVGAEDVKGDERDGFS
jgi:hypothetical protein